MRTGQSAVRRVAVVGAGCLLTATAFAGPALAQDTTTTSSSTSPTAACEQVVSELNDVVGQITNAQTALGVLQGLPTTVPDPTDVIDDPTGTVDDATGAVDDATGALSGADDSTTSGSADSSSSILEAPVDNKAFVTQADPTDLISQLQTQIATLQAQRGALASQFADLCSNLPSTASQGGTASEVPLSGYTSEAPTSDSTDSSYYDDATGTPVYATQVSSVPTGGVNTGDGSYGP